MLILFPWQVTLYLSDGLDHIDADERWDVVVISQNCSGRARVTRAWGTSVHTPGYCTVAHEPLAACAVGSQVGNPPHFRTPRTIPRWNHIGVGESPWLRWVPSLHA